MKTNVKNLKIGKIASSISFEHSNTNRSIELELKAIYILLGGYNEFGESIDIEKYNKIRDNFNQCINEIKELI